ncbi:MAG: cation-translocating P-type ATPase [Beijerinckiaceae bacterium]
MSAPVNEGVSVETATLANALESTASAGKQGGLSSAAAEERLRSEGLNVLPGARQRTLLHIVLEVLREPMLALLLGGGLVYLALGDTTEALLLVTFALLSIVITVVQEARTERVLDALRDLTSPRALVVRDGVQKRIAGHDVVRGDLLVLAEGDRVAADAQLVSCTDLQADESLLTGESVPVHKQAGVPPAEGQAIGPGDSATTQVFSGSLVVRGAGLAIVTATGARSQIGQIGQSLATLDPEPPRLRIETQKLVRLAALVGGGVSAIAVILYGSLRGGWLEALLAGIALGMSMLPEEFPVVLTVFLAMGAWRISKANVLTRRAAAIETLGAATVLCTDKTGTLTENRMTIGELWLSDGSRHAIAAAKDAPLPGPFRALVAAGRHASAIDPFEPMEKAFHTLDRASTEDGHLVRTYGLRPDLPVMSQVWRGQGWKGQVWTGQVWTNQVREQGAASHWHVAAKGAPEAVARLCNLDPQAMAMLTGAVDDMAARGLRVLAIADATWQGGPLPDDQTGFAFHYRGLAGFTDPLRASVPAAVQECHTAGIRVVMITGDYPVTAREIARQAGLGEGAVLTGADVEAMTATDLRAHVNQVMVFARIRPDQKLRIIEALKANGEIVAMTGDGVNDAPALKAAHIGIAMGQRGTDVAREASSMVLLDDDFSSIIHAIKLGRRIYDNLRKVMGFIISVHVPIAAMALLPLVFGLPILFTPVHIAFLELVIDPVCSLVFEAERDEDDIMQRPPRPSGQRLVSLQLAIWSLFQGLVAFLPVAAVVMIGIWRSMPVDELRAIAFVTMILSILSLIIIHRAFQVPLLQAIVRPNPTLAGILAVVIVLLVLVFSWPMASALFRFGPLHGDDIGMAVAGAGCVLLVLHVLKPLRRMNPAA